MLAAMFWGLVGGVALIVGALVGIFSNASTRVIALVMGFGSGVLISALSFELTREAFDRGGTTSVCVGLAAGSLTFFAGDFILDRRGAEHRKRSGGQQSSGAAGAIVLGSLLDGIPESVAIGVSLLGGHRVGLPVVAAVFLSNVPESLSAATGLQKAGHSTRWILGLWAGVAALSALAAGVGYVALDGVSGSVIAGIQAFAAGAILTMLADTMLPEATEGGGSAVGLVTVLGFALAFLLSEAA
jgi:ZIP family zinc transporter